MDLDETADTLPQSVPPLMPWQKFAEWIGMGDEPIVVRTWLDRGYLPSQKVGKRTMVNVALLHQQLLEQEWTL
ncbi:DNA-binding protein [Stutzerimonas nitrititolerans]|jgi:hypothetical protein|uniref:DNA-binding protein n=1 Tax=Stutzerimonas nitrititolerans TaxID=2482751 RepID=UPI00289E451D|nr:DNA-binding protein [Stutzerimonas nitrititolerans]